VTDFWQLTLILLKMLILILLVLHSVRVPVPDTITVLRVTAILPCMHTAMLLQQAEEADPMEMCLRTVQ
jgi:hypothetical protein